MTDQQFSNELVDALKDLNQFIVKSAPSNCVSVCEFQNILNVALGVTNEVSSTFSAILDRALSETEDEDLSKDGLSDIMDSLIDDLNEADPILRVIHNPSDKWSVVEKLSGDGFLEPIAYIASPNIAEASLDFFNSQVNNT